MGPGGLRGHPHGGPQPGMQGPPGDMAPQGAPPGAPAEQGAAAGGGPVSTATLAAQLAQATPEQQRMITGEALYPLVENLEPQSAAKVTACSWRWTTRRCCTSSRTTARCCPRCRRPWRSSARPGRPPRPALSPRASPTFPCPEEAAWGAE